MPANSTASKSTLRHVSYAARASEVHLTPIEFKLLRVLTQNRGRMLTHDALLQQVWGAAYMDARQTLRAHIANLRRKIEPADGERLIHTDHGVGYRLADVHPESARRRRPAEEVIDRDLFRICRSVRTRLKAGRLGQASGPRCCDGRAQQPPTVSRCTGRVSSPEPQVWRVRPSGARAV